MKKVTLHLGADHRGFELKNQLLEWLKQQNKLVVEVKDHGAYKLDPDDDYPDFAFAVGEAVVTEPGSLGVVICGSSVGVTVAANKVKGVRAASACQEFEVVHGRERDGLNVLTLAADKLDFKQAKQLVLTFIQIEPAYEPRFVRRIKKIESYERRSL